MSCDTVAMWQNSSRKHFGTPSNMFVKPTVRINGSVADIPDAYKIPLCYLERAELFQSGSAVANVATAALTVVNELVIPANTVKGGERFRGGLSTSASPVAGSTNVVTLSVRVTDAAGAVVAGTVTLVALTHPTSAPARQAVAMLDFYYDAALASLRIMSSTRNDSVYATTPGGSIPFDPTVGQRIQFCVQNSSIANSEVAIITFATLGRTN